MLYANDYDIHRWQQRYNAATGYPLLGQAADQLDALREWADANSDGWAYWPKPVRAAARLITLLQNADERSRDYRQPRLADADPADLTAALRPVKAFLTRQGVDWQGVLL